MKVMMIDPWGINNVSYYTKGICSNLSRYVNLELVSNYFFQKDIESIYKVKNIFFKRSEKMKKGIKRKIIRSFEYIFSYRKIVKLLKDGNYDIVHIQWLLFYNADLHFIKKIKKYCKKLIFTAHNVIPHVNGASKIKTLRKIYKIIDVIVLHGEGISNEFDTIFPEFKQKIYIQKHGRYFNQSTKIDITQIDDRISALVNNHGKKFIFFGHMFYNKGVDRVVNIWLKEFHLSNDLLIISGKKNENYDELSKLEKKITDCSNILYLSNYVEDNLLNYLISESNIILLPYRHASMSGVIFTAAEFGKTVLSTNIGSLTEYIKDKENSFIVESNENSICETMKYISRSVSIEELASMGQKLKSHIIKNYNWENITSELVENCYKR